MRISPPRWIALGLGMPALALAFALLARAEIEPATGTLYVRGDDAGLRAVVEIAIEPGWILYHTEVGGDPDEHGRGYPGRALVVEPRGSGLVFSPARVPDPVRHEDPLLRNWAWAHAGHIRVYLAARGARGAPAVPGDLRVALSGSTCSDEGVCMRYEETLAPAGPGPDALFAGFPDDLRPPAR
jgi:hypothetical protein